MRHLTATTNPPSPSPARTARHTRPRLPRCLQTTGDDVLPTLRRGDVPQRERLAYSSHGIGISPDAAWHRPRLVVATYLTCSGSNACHSARRKPRSAP